MIIELLLDAVFSLVESVLSILPNPDLSFSGDMMEKLFEILEVGFYLLPMGTVVPIILILITVMNVRIGISLIKTIWELIPLL